MIALALRALLAAALLLGAGTCLAAARAQGPGDPGGGSEATQGIPLDVPSHPVDVVLGRPTGRSIAVSVLASEGVDTYISYGTAPTAAGHRTPLKHAAKGQAATVSIGSLRPNTRYWYRLFYRPAGATAFSKLAASPFRTLRPAGSAFTFSVQADSHLDSNSSTDVYRRTLLSEAADQPDFLVDLGDTFMTDRYTPYTAARDQYVAQHYYLGLVGAPVFLALGNHDGEAGFRTGGASAGMPAWSAQLRNALFPNPPDAQSGRLRDYYAWEWGGALFVVLDPFWFTTAKSSTGDNWSWTLGKAQYAWLAKTLQGSEAHLKFVFIHHLVGGEGKDNRGGAEAARFFEWGGENLDGSDGFAANRAGWALPIHRLLVENGVTAVFHGHDHLFAEQVLDGIVYQEVPQPSNVRPQPNTNAAEYGYLSGVIMGGPGHLRVTVAGGRATIDYIRTSSSGAMERTVSYSYTVG